MFCSKIFDFQDFTNQQSQKMLAKYTHENILVFENMYYKVTACFCSELKIKNG